MLRVRLRGWMVDLRDSLWLLPAAAIVAAIVLANVLVRIDTPVWLPDALTFGGTPDGARSVLSELANATITVTGLVFSLTVIALQMAASQFTPRLLRTFLADRKTQLVLAGLLGSAVYDVAVLRTVRSTGEDVELFVPEIAVSVGLLLATVAVGLLVFFLHHVTRQLRVDLVMVSIADETRAQLRRLPAARGQLPDRRPPTPPAGARIIVAERGGYLQTVDVEALADAARDAGVRLSLRAGLGEAIARGTTLAWVWPDGGPLPDGAEDVDLGPRIHAAVHLGPDRTESRDLTFGLRQLVDIAIKALSTSVNDPTTARQAVEQLSSILVELAHHPIGSDLAFDDDGEVRAAAPRPTFAAYLALATTQIRRYGSGEPDTLLALAGMLTDVAEQVADEAARAAAVRHELELLSACEVPDPDESARVEDAIAGARAALGGGGRTAGEREQA